MHRRVLFICKKRNDSYGVSIGLYNSAKFIANFLNDETNISAKVVTVIDSNGIDKEVHDYNPTHIVIHAIWVPAYKLQELLKLYPNIKWQVRIHSKIPFLANEGIAMDWLFQYKNITNNNLIISANSEEATRDLDVALNMPITYLPNIYWPDPSDVKNTNSSNYLNVGCFGAIRPFKNTLMQAIVAINYANTVNKILKFYVNAERTEQAGEQNLKNIKALFKNSKHQLIECKWQNHNEFLGMVANMDLGMQVSFTETYNIVAADFVYMNVPVIVSPEINWMPFIAKANPNDSSDIFKTLKFNINHEWIITKTNEIFLQKENVRAENIWLDYLKI